MSSIAGIQEASSDRRAAVALVTWFVSSGPRGWAEKDWQYDTWEPKRPKCVQFIGSYLQLFSPRAPPKLYDRVRNSLCWSLVRGHNTYGSLHQRLNFVDKVTYLSHCVDWLNITSLAKGMTNDRIQLWYSAGEIKCISYPYQLTFLFRLYALDCSQQ